MQPLSLPLPYRKARQAPQEPQVRLDPQAQLARPVLIALSPGLPDLQVQPVLQEPQARQVLQGQPVQPETASQVVLTHHLQAS